MNSILVLLEHVRNCLLTHIQHSKNLHFFRNKAKIPTLFQKFLFLLLPHFKSDSFSGKIISITKNKILMAYTSTQI